MDGQVFKSSNYSIYKFNAEAVNLYELSTFAVVENYKHHQGANTKENFEEEIQALYREDVLYSEHSMYYVAFDTSCKMTGTIRIMKWDKQSILPIQEIFRINPLRDIECLSPDNTIWHIGRFVVSSSKQIPGITLFKQMLVYALTPLYKNSKDIIIAECDCRLVRVLSALGIETNTLGKSYHYLGSDTVPVYLTHHGIVNFYEKHKEIVHLSKA